LGIIFLVVFSVPFFPFFSSYFFLSLFFGHINFLHTVFLERASGSSEDMRLALQNKKINKKENTENKADNTYKYPVLLRSITSFNGPSNLSNAFRSMYLIKRRKVKKAQKISKL
jgi:hypothetical protein